MYNFKCISGYCNEKMACAQLNIQINGGNCKSDLECHGDDGGAFCNTRGVCGPVVDGLTCSDDMDCISGHCNLLYSRLCDQNRVGEDYNMLCPGTCGRGVEGVPCVDDTDCIGTCFDNICYNTLPAQVITSTPVISCVCAAVYSPVCDTTTQITYSNSCSAQCAEVYNTISGTC